MRNTGARLIACAVLVGCTVFPVTNTFSQDEPKDAAVEARDLFVEIEEKGQEFARTIEQARAAAGDDADALFKRSTELVDELLAMVDQVAENVMDREEAGEDTTADREKVAELYGRTTDFLQSSVDRTRARSQELRAKRKDAAPEDLEEIEEEIAAMNRWHGESLSMLLDQVEHMEAFGLNASEKKRFLIDAVEQRA
jgi:hypothetical protein